MPFFYKLTDYTNHDDRIEWINKVSFTMADFILTCHRNSTNYNKKGVQILIFDMNNIDVNKHYKSNLKLEFEYVSYEDIPSDRIIYISDEFTKNNVIKSDKYIKNGLSLDQTGEDNLENFIDDVMTYTDDNDIEFDNLYLHITCSEYVSSIEENGLLHDSGNRVGDYESETEEDEENTKKRGRSEDENDDDERPTKLYREDEFDDFFELWQGEGGKRNKKSKKRKIKKGKLTKKKNKKNKSSKRRIKRNKISKKNIY